MEKKREQREEKEDPKELNSGGGLPGLKPPTVDQLPDEEKWQLEDTSENRQKAGLYGEFRPEEQRQEDTPPSETVFDEQDSALTWFQRKTTEGFKFWAQFTRYNIKMDDGRTIQYYRVPLKKYEADEILDLSAEVQSRQSIEDDKPLGGNQLRRKEKLLDELKAKYYLRNSKTNEPMSAVELRHVNDSTIIDSILEACLAITVAKWAEGKK